MPRYKLTLRPLCPGCTPSSTKILDVEPTDEWSLYGYFTTAEPIEPEKVWHFDIVECPEGSDKPAVGQYRIDRMAHGKAVWENGTTRVYQRRGHTDYHPSNLHDMRHLMAYTKANWDAYVKRDTGEEFEEL